MGMMSFGMAEMACDEREYAGWVTSLSEASARLDVLEAAVAELRRLCQTSQVDSDKVLQVLERHGAMPKVSRRHSHAA